MATLFESSLPATTWSSMLLLYGAVEAAFFLYFKFVLVPQAQKRSATAPYRDYGNERHKLLLRVLDRIERTCKSNNRDVRQVVGEYFAAWFRRKDKLAPPTLHRIPSSSTLDSSIMSDEDGGSGDYKDSSSPSQHWNIEGLCKDEFDEFFCWSFFEKHVHELEAWEQTELEKTYNILSDRYGLVFPPGRGNFFESRLMTLEAVSPHHRPFLVYFMVMLAMTIGDLILFIIGFRRFVTKSGLTYWYRQGMGTTSQDHHHHLPLLFFHGVAPAGKTFYLPMVLMGLGGYGRPTFLFENPNVSWTLMCQFDAITEEQTVRGVQEAIEEHVKGDDTPVTLCGHSLGSSTVACLLNSPLRDRIGQVVVIDPIAILISEPDAVVNFLYSRSEVTADDKDRSKIHAASSEIFTEHYLRRHVAYYNFELWMDDIPEDVPTLVCLAELDEIISEPKVRKEVEMHRSKIKKLSLIQWNQAGHAQCVSDPSTWGEIRACMLDHEREVEDKI